MSGQETQRHEMTTKSVVYPLPGAESVVLRRDVEYRAADGGTLAMDLYYPPDSKREQRIPAVVMVAGYPDPGFEAMLGCKFKEMESYISWGRLMAASGLAAIAYTNREPIADLDHLVDYLRQNARRLGIDENRIGIWACSGNVPLALSRLMQKGQEYVKCAVLFYGCMLDLDGSTHMAEAASKFGFVNPCAGRTVEDLPQRTALFVVRAGRDEMPHLNDALDRFVGKALARNLPLTLVNHSEAPHAFDLLHDSELSREVIRQTLAFLRFHLLGVSPSK